MILHDYMTMSFTCLNWKSQGFRKRILQRLAQRHRSIPRAFVDSVLPVPAGPAGAAPSLMCKASTDPRTHQGCQLHHFIRASSKAGDFVHQGESSCYLVPTIGRPNRDGSLFPDHWLTFRVYKSIPRNPMKSIEKGSYSTRTSCISMHSMTLDDP